MILEPHEYDLIKAITRTEAKAVHKELPPGGSWRTMNGHHIYIKDGKVLAGAIPGVAKAKKATKAQLSAHQETIDKEAKAKKKPASKTKAPVKPKAPVKKPATKAKPKATAKGATVSATKKPVTKKTAKPDVTPAKDTKPSGARKPVSTAGTKKPASKSPAKGTTAKTAGVKDIRSDAQKNRTLAYDVGDKVGGARKDEFEASFKQKPTIAILDKLEKENGAVAEKLVTKAHLLPKFDFEAEHKNGVDLPTAILKKLLQDRIDQKPIGKTPEARKAYMASILKFQRHFAGIKTIDNMQNAIREFSDLASRQKQGKRSEHSLKSYEEKPERYSYFNKDSHEETAKKGQDAKKLMDFSPLGDKFEGFFSDYKKRESTINTVKKNMKEGWDKYLNPQAKTAPKKKPGSENKKWERKAEAEHLRTGGKATKVSKPEELVKEFGLRGVEFGHWVNDSSGLYHLQRSAEALNDLADVIGVDPKDISLNGRLAIAFGARGKGTALAHYEPDRKVINMTKYGGAGSLAHEWGHAMDNILYQYSHGGKESMGLASDDINDMGNNDPKLKALYENVMNTIVKPVPGDKGASQKITLDTSTKAQPGKYYPEMRRQVTDGMNPSDVYQHWTQKIDDKHDRYIASVRENRNGFYKSQPEVEKQVQKYERDRNREKGKITQYLAHELRYKQNGKYGGDHYTGEIEVPTGNSEYYQRMLETQTGKNQNGSHYWSQGCEMFARVFESYVQDKLDKGKRYNNYLVHGTREGNVKVEDAPFPIGKERTAMFKAMGNLMAHVAKGKTLKKALILDILANGQGDMTEELRKSLGTGVERKRSAFNVANPEEVIYIPLNRLKTPYQTEKATNWDKVQENVERMVAGENLEPIVIGLDYDIQDGHHRFEASHLADYEHAPCIVKGGNDIERQRAIEAYKELWKSTFIVPLDNQKEYRRLMSKTYSRSLIERYKEVLEETGNKEEAFNYTVEDFDMADGEEIEQFWQDLNNLGQDIPDTAHALRKAIVTDPVAPDAFVDDAPFMYRGIGQRELLAIADRGYIQTKGKGNDDDKDKATCFSNLYSQAVGYAISNYDLYNEKQAYVIAVPKPSWIEEDETGELVAHQPVPTKGMDIIPIPKPE